MEASETGAADAVALPALDGLRKPSGQKAEMRLLDTNTFADVLKHVDADTLLLLDIDETLLVSTCVLNSSAWWSYIFAKFEESALPDAKLFPLLKRLLNIVLEKVPFKPIEESTPGLLRDLQRQGVAMLGITSRSHTTIFVPRSDLVTKRHLEGAGIVLDERNFRDRYGIDGESVPAEMKHGVLFAGGSRLKGHALQKLLNAAKSKPGKAVMIDDVREQLESVGASALAMGIGFTGLRYGRSDDNVNFELQHAWISDIQLQTLLEEGRVLSDAEARELIPSRSTMFVNDMLFQLRRSEPDVVMAKWVV